MIKKKSAQKKPVRNLGASTSGAAGVSRLAQSIPTPANAGAQPNGGISDGRAVLPGDEAQDSSFPENPVVDQPSHSAPEQQATPNMGDASHRESVPAPSGKPAPQPNKGKSQAPAAKNPGDESQSSSFSDPAPVTQGSKGQSSAPTPPKMAQSVPEPGKIEEQPNADSSQAPTPPKMAQSAADPSISVPSGKPAPQPNAGTSKAPAPSKPSVNAGGEQSSIPAKPVTTSQPNKNVLETQPISSGPQAIGQAQGNSIPTVAPVTQPNAGKSQAPAGSKPQGDSESVPNAGAAKTYDHPNPRSMIIANKTTPNQRSEYAVSDRLQAFHDKLQGRRAEKAPEYNEDPADQAERQAMAWDAGNKAAAEGNDEDTAKVAYQTIDIGCMKEFAEGFKAFASQKTAEIHRYMVEEAIGVANGESEEGAGNFAKEMAPELKKWKESGEWDGTIDSAIAVMESHGFAVEHLKGDKQAQQKGDGNDSAPGRHPDMADVRPLSGEAISGTGGVDSHGIAASAKFKLLTASKFRLGSRHQWARHAKHFSKASGPILAYVTRLASDNSATWSVGIAGQGVVVEGRVPASRFAMIRAMAYSDLALSHLAGMGKSADMQEFMDQQFTKTSDETGEHDVTAKIPEGWHEAEDGSHFKYFDNNLTAVIKPKKSKFKWKAFAGDDKIEKGKSKSVTEAQSEVEACMASFKASAGDPKKVAWGYTGVPPKDKQEEEIVDMGHGEHVPLEPKDYGKYLEAHLKEAVDEKTKEYYDEYYGGYGEQLTKDMAPGPVPAKHSSRTVASTIAWEDNYKGHHIMILEEDGYFTVKIDMEKVPGVMPYGDLASAKSEAKSMVRFRTGSAKEAASTIVWHDNYHGLSCDVLEEDGWYYARIGSEKIPGEMPYGDMESAKRAVKSIARMRNGSQKEASSDDIMKLSWKSVPKEIKEKIGSHFEPKSRAEVAFNEKHGAAFGEGDCYLVGADNSGQFRWEKRSAQGGLLDSGMGFESENLAKAACERHACKSAVGAEGAAHPITKTATNEGGEPPAGHVVFGDSVAANSAKWPPAARGTLIWIEDTQMIGDRNEVALGWDKSLNEACSPLQMEHHLKTFIQQLGTQLEKYWGIVSDIEITIIDFDKAEAVATFRSSARSPFIPAERIGQ